VSNNQTSMGPLGFVLAHLSTNIECSFAVLYFCPMIRPARAHSVLLLLFSCCQVVSCFCSMIRPEGCPLGSLLVYLSIERSLVLFSLGQVIRTPSILLVPFLSICRLRIPENSNDDVVELL